MSDLSSRDLRTLFRETPTAAVLVDPDGRIRHVNPQAAELFGYRPEELEGEEVEILVPEGLRSRHREDRRSYMEDPTPRPMGIGMELAGRHRDGSRVPVEISLVPVELEEGFRVMAAVRDISERREVRAWGVDAVEAAEEERLRVAHELHDDIAQRLATLQVRAKLISREDGDGWREGLEELRAEIRELSEQLRELIRGLRPPALSDLGLGAAVRNDLSRQLEGREIDGDLSLEPIEPRPVDHVELAVFRVAQESIRNAVRHAEPSTVRVRLRERTDGTIELEVEDDGDGFDPEEAREKDDRFGLIGMRERCGAVGGRLEVETRPGAGTLIRARFPRRTEEGAAGGSAPGAEDRDRRPSGRRDRSET